MSQTGSQASAAGSHGVGSERKGFADLPDFLGMIDDPDGSSRDASGSSGGKDDLASPRTPPSRPQHRRLSRSGSWRKGAEQVLSSPARGIGDLPDSVHESTRQTLCAVTLATLGRIGPEEDRWGKKFAKQGAWLRQAVTSAEFGARKAAAGEWDGDSGLPPACPVLLHRAVATKRGSGGMFSRDVQREVLVLARVDPPAPAAAACALREGSHEDDAEGASHAGAEGAEPDALDGRDRARSASFAVEEGALHGSAASGGRSPSPSSSGRAGP